jgi:hypothetical protein
VTTKPNDDLIWLIRILGGLFILVIIIAAVSVLARTRRQRKVDSMTVPPRQADEEIFHGFRFQVVPGLDVPEEARRHDQEFHPGPKEALPEYCSIQHGVWVPAVTSLEEVRADVKTKKST